MAQEQTPRKWLRLPEPYGKAGSLPPLIAETQDWEGVDYEKANIKITKNLNYAPRDPIYYKAARDFATPAKGRAMADCAIKWVVKQMEDMLSK